MTIQTEIAPVPEDELPPMQPERARNFKAVVLLVSVLVVLAIAIALQQSASGGGSSATRPALASASLRSFPIVATATGTIVPASEIHVNFSTDGRLTEIDVKVGDTVSKGAVLAKVDPTSAQAAADAAKAGLAAARTPIEVARARGDLAQAQVNLAATTLVAPADGTVQAINGQVGESVPTAPTAAPTLPGTDAPIPSTAGSGASPSSASPSLVELSTRPGVVVGAAFSASDAPQLSPGQTGTLTSSAITGLSLPCHLLARAPTATLVDGLPRFYASIVPDGTDTRLLAGMPADVSITTGQASRVIAVPNQSIYVLDGKTHVDVWFKNHALPTVVVTGLIGAELTEVRSGLSDGEQVILSAPNGLPSPATTSAP